MLPAPTTVHVHLNESRSVSGPPIDGNLIFLLYFFLEKITVEIGPEGVHHAIGRYRAEREAKHIYIAQEYSQRFPWMNGRFILIPPTHFRMEWNKKPGGTPATKITIKTLDVQWWKTIYAIVVCLFYFIFIRLFHRLVPFSAHSQSYTTAIPSSSRPFWGNAWYLHTVSIQHVSSPSIDPNEYRRRVTLFSLLVYGQFHTVIIAHQHLVGFIIIRLPFRWPECRVFGVSLRATTELNEGTFANRTGWVGHGWARAIATNPSMLYDTKILRHEGMRGEMVCLAWWRYTIVVT